MNSTKCFYSVTCALLLTSHFSMFERYRNCETFCNFYAILFFFLAKCFIAYQDQIHASSCYTGFKWISIAVWDHISTGSILEYVQQSFGLFPWTLFIFEHFYLSVVFFQCLLFLALFTSSLFDIASFSNDLCSILGVFLLLLIYFRIIQLYLRHSIEIKQIDLFLLLFLQTCFVHSLCYHLQ